MQEFFAWLLATFVLAPMQAELGDRLRAVNAAPQLIQQAQSCVAAAAPALTERAANDWVWTAQTVISVATGLSDANAVLVEVVPGCAPVVQAATRLTEPGDV